MGEDCLQGCRVSDSFQFGVLKNQGKFRPSDTRAVIYSRCRLSGGETAAGESAVRDSQDATEAGRAVCSAWGAGGGGGPRVNLR